MKTQVIKNSVVAALLSFTTVAFSTTPPPTEKQSISKELVTKTTASGTTTFDWVVKYENTSGGPLENVEIVDTFSSNQSYVPSSEQHPNGWSATQSGNNIQWNAGSVGGDGYARPFSPPSPSSGGSFTSEGDGDGWGPIPYQGRIYVINHHLDNSRLSFQCFGSCVGVWPKNLPDGDPNSPLNSNTSNDNETEIIGSKLYYAVTRISDSGLGCYDLDTNLECGYVQLSNRGSSISPKIEGPFKSGSNLYLIGTDIKVHCVNPASMTSCGTFDIALPVGVGSANQIGGEVSGTRIYFATRNNHRIFCFDTTTNSPCWSGVAKTAVDSVPYGPSAFLYYSTGMIATHFCIANTTQECFDLNTGASTTSLTPIGIPTINFWGNGGEFTYKKKSYFPRTNTGDVTCFDWSTNLPCIPSTISNPAAANYAAAVDEAGCAWVYSHNKIMWSFDPETNTTPCEKPESEFGFEDTFDASKNWCATEDPEWAYNQFQITNITASDFEELIVEFLDPSGSVIKSTDITGSISHSQGLFTASFTAGDPIHYRIKVKLASGVTDYTTIPLVMIGVDGPPQEFCFSTTVDCPNTEPVVNDVLVQIQGEAPDATDTVTVEAETTCDVSNNDEITPQSCPATTGSGSVDVVILVDSSSSMSSSWAAVIDASDTLAESIKERCGADANITLLSIDKVDPGTGASAPAGFISHEKYIIDNTSYTGAFANNDGGGAYEGEQGAKAIADVSNHFPWKEGACRSILYISDEWLDSVNKGEAGSTASIPIGVGAANSNSVTLFTHLVGYGASNPIKADHFTELAESTGGTSHIGDTPSKELYKELVSEAACNCGCEELPEDPKSCLVLEPKLECIVDKGWHVSFTNSTPGFTPTYLDITSLTSGVSVVGNSPTWTLSGVTPNSTVKLSANGVMKNGGSEKGNDLCCSSEVEIEIPEEECPIIDSPVEACMVAETTPAGPFFDSGSNQWSFPLQLTSLNINTLDEVKVTPVTTGVIMMNGPVYPVGTPSLSFTGVTTGQTVEFNFCAYNRSDKEENETYDCCKMNVRLKIRESVSPKDYQQLEVVK